MLARVGRTYRQSPRGYVIFVVTVLMLISILKVADRELLAPLYEPVSQELGLDDLQFGTVRSATNVALVLGSLLFGWLADRWRRRDVVGLGVLCWSAITWGTGRVDSFWGLLVAPSKMILSGVSALTAFAIGAISHCAGTGDWKSACRFSGHDYGLARRRRPLCTRLSPRLARRYGCPPRPRGPACCAGTRQDPALADLEVASSDVVRP